MTTTLDLRTGHQPAANLVPVTDLEPLDEIAGPDQPDGPWLLVAVIPTSDYSRIVVLDQDGTEHDVACQPGQLVRRRQH
jgi:hypothetical protein